MPADIIRFCCCVILLLLVDVVIVHVDLSIVKRSLIVAAVLALLYCGCDAMLLLLLLSSGWCCYIFSLPIGVITRSCNAVFVARVIGIVRRRQKEKGKGKWEGVVHVEKKTLRRSKEEVESSIAVGGIKLII